MQWEGLLAAYTGPFWWVGVRVSLAVTLIPTCVKRSFQSPQSNDLPSKRSRSQFSRWKCLNLFTTPQSFCSWLSNPQLYPTAHTTSHPGETQLYFKNHNKCLIMKQIVVLIKHHGKHHSSHSLNILLNVMLSFGIFPYYTVTKLDSHREV